MKIRSTKKIHGSENGIHVPLIEIYRNNQLSGLIKNTFIIK